LRAYRYGPQVLWMEEGGNIFFLHADGQSSVRVVTNLSGQVVAEYSYDAFGNQLEGENGWNPFKYCGIFGYREDEEINLMKVGARYYDPTIGRWIQKDPILSGVNWWLYCDNDPVNKVDPEGKQGGAPEFPPEAWGGHPSSCPKPYPLFPTPHPINPLLPEPSNYGPCCPEYIRYPSYFGEPQTVCGRGAHLTAIFAFALLIMRLWKRREDE